MHKLFSEERAISEPEASVIGWLLDRAALGDITEYRRRPVNQLRVIGGCDCGCTSLDFRPHLRGARIIADALAVYSDGQQAGLILWGWEGEIIWLEVYDCHPEASHRFPKVPDLRTFEERGREL